MEGSAAARGVTRGIMIALCGGIGFGVSTISTAGRVDAMPSGELRRALTHGEPPGLRLGTNPGAPVLRVFGDYACSACAEFERQTGDALRALARKGEIRLVYHDAALHAHRRHPTVSAVSYCARASSRTWDVHALAYRAAATADPRPARERLLEAAGGLVADPVRLERCSTAAGTQQEIEAEWAFSDRIGIDRVPTLFLGEDRLVFRSYRGLLRFVARRATR